MEELRVLKEQHEQGKISSAAYETRRRELVDAMTGTSSTIIAPDDTHDDAPPPGKDVEPSQKQKQQPSGQAKSAPQREDMVESVVMIPVVDEDDSFFEDDRKKSSARPASTKEPEMKEEDEEEKKAPEGGGADDPEQTLAELLQEFDSMGSGEEAEEVFSGISQLESFMAAQEEGAGESTDDDWLDQLLGADSDPTTTTTTTVRSSLRQASPSSSFAVDDDEGGPGDPVPHVSAPWSHAAVRQSQVAVSRKLTVGGSRDRSMSLWAKPARTRQDAAPLPRESDALAAGVAQSTLQEFARALDSAVGKASGKGADYLNILAVTRDALSSHDLGRADMAYQFSAWLDASLILSAEDSPPAAERWLRACVNRLWYFIDIGLESDGDPRNLGEPLLTPPRIESLLVPLLHHSIRKKQETKTQRLFDTLLTSVLPGFIESCSTTHHSAHLLSALRCLAVLQYISATLIKHRTVSGARGRKLTVGGKRATANVVRARTMFDAMKETCRQMAVQAHRLFAEGRGERDEQYQMWANRTGDLFVLAASRLYPDNEAMRDDNQYVHQRVEELMSGHGCTLDLVTQITDKFAGKEKSSHMYMTSLALEATVLMKRARTLLDDPFLDSLKKILLASGPCAEARANPAYELVSAQQKELSVMRQKLSDCPSKMTSALKLQIALLRTSAALEGDPSMVEHYQILMARAYAFAADKQPAIFSYCAAGIDEVISKLKRLREFGGLEYREARYFCKSAGGRKKRWYQLSLMHLSMHKDEMHSQPEKAWKVADMIKTESKSGLGGMNSIRISMKTLKDSSITLYGKPRDVEIFVKQLKRTRKLNATLNTSLQTLKLAAMNK